MLMKGIRVCISKRRKGNGWKPPFLLSMRRTDQYEMNLSTGLNESVSDRVWLCAIKEEDDDMAERMVEKENVQLKMKSVELLCSSFVKKPFLT